MIYHKPETPLIDHPDIPKKSRNLLEIADEERWHITELEPLVYKHARQKYPVDVSIGQAERVSNRLGRVGIETIGELVAHTLPELITKYRPKGKRKDGGKMPGMAVGVRKQIFYALRHFSEHEQAAQTMVKEMMPNFHTRRPDMRDKPENYGFSLLN